MADTPLDTVRAHAERIAQDAVGTTHAVPLLTSNPGDYDAAVAHALLVYAQDQPNVRVIDHTVSAEAWRFVLAGTGALAALAGADTFAEGASLLQEVWAPYVAAPEAAPLDREMWRVRRDPGALVLEVLDRSLTSGDVLRLVFTAPHALTHQSTSVPTATWPVLALLVASQVLQLAANRAVQNTGSSGLPNDIVDRRTQSDIFRSRAKELREQYQSLVGTRRGSGPMAASTYRDLDVRPGTPLGFLWRNTRRF